MEPRAVNASPISLRPPPPSQTGENKKQAISKANFTPSKQKKRRKGRKPPGRLLSLTRPGAVAADSLQTVLFACGKLN